MVEFLFGYLIGSSSQPSAPLTGRRLAIGLLILAVIAVIAGGALLLLSPSNAPADSMCEMYSSGICELYGGVFNAMKWFVPAAIAIMVAAVVCLKGER